MTFGERLRDLRLKKGLTQKQLAEQIGAKHNSVSNWENNQNKPSLNILEKICSVLDVDYFELLESEIGIDIKQTNTNDFEFTNEEYIFLKGLRELDQHGKNVVYAVYDEEYKRVMTEKSSKFNTKIQLPLYDIAVSAGTGQFLDSSYYELVDVPNDAPSNASFILKITGDSMEPTFYNHDMVYVQQKPSIEIGEVGIFMINGDVYIKELSKGGLVSHNPAYPEIYFNEYDTIKCYGKVIGIYKK